MVVIRYEEKESVFEVNHFAVAPDGGPKINIPLLDPKPDWDNFSPEVTLSYQYNDDVMFFASYRTGFKSGGFDAAWKPGDLLATYGLTGESPTKTSMTKRKLMVSKLE